MIISFSVENWMSFKEPVTFSMVASRERQHSERVPQVSKYNTRILPIAAIYGGNASGKTNFFKALNFIKKMVITGTLPDSMITVEPYRLDSDSLEKPSRFKLELLIDGTIYEFGFAATSKAIVEEKLVEIGSATEKVLYDRVKDKPNFDKSLEKEQFLHFAFQGTRDNQLFLTNSVSQKVDTFRPVYDWFKSRLELIAPDTRFGAFELFVDEANPIYVNMNAILPRLDTGISHIGGEEISLDNAAFPDVIKDDLQEKVIDNTVMKFIYRNDRFVAVRDSGKLVVKKLVAYHTKSDGTETKFEMRQESDGSLRVIDLLPAFLKMSSECSKKTYIIDEIDRSLHTLLTRQLLEAYLANCSVESRAQLLFTTHDVLLMDQQLLRRDEMWVAERDMNGVSSLIAFSEYKDVRYDKDIRKSYLKGRMGGVPRILLDGFAAGGGEKS